MSTINTSAAVVPDNEAGDPAAGRWVTLFCAVSFLFFLGSFSHVFGGEEGAGTGELKFLFAPIALVIQLTAVFLLATPQRAERTRALIQRNGVLLVALVIVVASSAWSIDPEVTLRRAIALLGTTAIGMLVYVEIGRADILRFLGVCLAVFVVFSIAIAIVVPELGTHVSGKHSGDWRGLLTFKNQAAWIAAIFLLVWLGAKQSGQLRFWRYPLAAVGAFFLVQTGSATGLAAIASGLLALLIVRWYSTVPEIRPLIVVTIAAVAFFVAIDAEALFERALAIVGRDSSLTGRTSVWTTLWPIIDENFWLGTGYSAFWDNASDYLGYSNWVAEIGHAHNTYFEMLLGVGLLGLIAQVGFLLVVLVRLMAQVTAGDRAAATMVAVVLMLAVVGIAGVVFFRSNSGLWVLMVVIACYAADSSSTVAPHRSAGIV